ncbi:hypothetical protein ZWY2020_041376 [Hordeum vulgare]|nr:hypothetical protein ZWY2020_041376 [Hordeum vulgare]
MLQAPLLSPLYHSIHTAHYDLHTATLLPIVSSPRTPTSATRPPVPTIPQVRDASSASFSDNAAPPPTTCPPSFPISNVDTSKYATSAVRPIPFPTSDAVAQPPTITSSSFPCHLHQCLHRKYAIGGPMMSFPRLRDPLMYPPLM